FTSRPGPGPGRGGGGPGDGRGGGRPSFDLGPAPVGGDRDSGQLLGLDAVTQVLDTDGAVISSVPGQPALPLDAHDSPRAPAAADRAAPPQPLTSPIPVRGAAEVGRLAASFNTMLVALDTSRRQQQRLVADASHELRTPLTAVRTNIEFLERADTIDGEQR